MLNRIRLEEELLTEEFQDAYQKHKEITKKLIPFIYRDELEGRNLCDPNVELPRRRSRNCHKAAVWKVA